MATACDHVFHQSCLKLWFEEFGRMQRPLICPSCRQILIEEDEFAYDLVPFISAAGFHFVWAVVTFGFSLFEKAVVSDSPLDESGFCG